jgi:putative Mg2+ transporter-C (MgtC) family protein
MLDGLDLSFDFWDTVSQVVKLGLAYLLALPIGWNREMEERSAGIRTFPLVAMASCGFVMIAINVLGAGSPEQSKVIEGLISGVGFIGGGAILKRGNHAHGTATAASLWATGALGVAVGYGQVDIAVTLSVVTFAALRLFSPLLKSAAGETHRASDPKMAGGQAKAGAEGPRQV